MCRWISSTIHPSQSPSISPLPRRNVLFFKCTSSIFDPLRLITPVTISAKLFLQQLWQQHHEWNSDLDEELCAVWNTVIYFMLQHCHTLEGASLHYTILTQFYMSLQMPGCSCILAVWNEFTSCDVKGQSCTRQATFITET